MEVKALAEAKVSYNSRKGSLAFLVTVMLCMAANALEVYQISGDVTGGIDLLGMSETYYTDRLKGKDNKTISGEVTHSAVTVENPFLLMGNHAGATAFNPSTKLDTIPIRIVDGGYWKYQSNDGGNANYRIKSGYGNLEMEKGVFGANAILLYGDAGGERSYLTVTNGCRLEIGTTIRVGLETNDGSASGTLVLDGGEIVMYTVLELGRGPNNGTAPYNASVNTAIVANATMTLTASDGENVVYMGRFGANNGANRDSDRNVLILGEDGILHAKGICRCRDPRGHVIFRGGTLELFRRGTNNNRDYAFENKDSGILEIEGDGAPIRIDVGDNDYQVISPYNDSTSSTILTGDGGFEKCGSGTLILNNIYNTVRASFRGGVAVDEGTLKLGARGMIPATNMLSVAENAVFDMSGYDVGLTGAVGAGVVTNSSETATTLTLGYGDGDYAFSAAVGGGVLLVKKGTGTLTVSGNAANNNCDLDITAGTVAFAAKNSSSYGNVTVRSGATLDISKCNFTCVSLVKESGGTIKHKLGLSVIVR